MTLISEKMLEVIGLVIVAIVGGLWAWLTNRKESAAKAEKALADAKKALAESDAAKKQADADIEKTTTEADVLANQAAFDTLLKSNNYLQTRLANQDKRIETLEAEIQVIKAERETLLCENRELRAKMETLRQKYDILKAAIIQTFDQLVSEIIHLEAPLIDKGKVIEAIQHARDNLPKTGPLGHP